jgi:hypothetical protein
MVDVEPAVRHRRVLSFAAVLGLLMSLFAASPAAAAQHCGAWKVVRVSISYQACTTTSGSNVIALAVFQNNHGSAVNEVWQYGYSIGGGAVEWHTITDDVLSAANGGRSQRQVPDVRPCGIHARLVIRAASTAGFPPPWGNGSYDAERSFPC